MNVLHLCSYYYGSKLYENLMREFDVLDLKQDVYIPVMKGIKVDAENFGNCRFIAKETYGSLDRMFFYKKFKQNYKALLESTKIEELDLVHAHTLFTNGVMAYKLKKEFGLPYVVAVRNSDLNTFFRYFIHLRKLGQEILKNAEKIIFISPAYMEQTINNYVKECDKSDIRKKSIVIPNGVNQFWIENLNGPKTIDGKFKLLYAGELTENKNIHNVIKDVVKMRAKGMDVEYTVVGEGEYKKNIEELIKSEKAEEYVKLHQKITDKDKLKETFRNNNVFVMTSTFETFGLSYIEALSQGLPVLYTKGQGIDGFFKNGKVGYSVPLGESIENALINIAVNYNNMSKNAITVVERFKWDSIGKRYLEIYKDIKG